MKTQHIRLLSDTVRAHAASRWGLVITVSSALALSGCLEGGGGGGESAGAASASPAVATTTAATGSTSSGSTTTPSTSATTTKTGTTTPSTSTPSTSTPSTSTPSTSTPSTSTPSTSTPSTSTPSTPSTSPTTPSTQSPVAEPSGITYSGPIRITRGGIYTGNWQSLDPNTPAVTVATGEPVVIENANIRSAGTLIHAFNTDLTVRNTYGRGLNPNVRGVAPGRFIRTEDFLNLVVENCDLESTSGIYLRGFFGNPAAGQGIRIVRNRAKNIDGRHSDGAGGWLTGSEDLRQFVQFNQVRGVPGVEIAWNEVINEPDASRVEDNISIFESSGTAGSPIRIHDNYIHGAYAYPATSQTYNGGGIMLGDGTGPTIASVPQYVEAYDNQVVASMGYGLGISSGHDLRYYRNRVVANGVLADGRITTNRSTVGLYLWDWRGDRSRGFFYGNLARDNVVGVRIQLTPGQLVRNDVFFPDCSAAGIDGNVCTNNTSLADPLTVALETAERDRWRAKVSAAGVRIGR
jgi:hypothetical protein